MHHTTRAGSLVIGLLPGAASAQAKELPGNMAADGQAHGPGEGLPFVRTLGSAI